jgi:sigma-E factor negative regulatory protein RseC
MNWIEQSARVVSVGADGVLVEPVEPEGGCGACDGKGCGTRRLAELFSRRPRNFRADSDLGLQPGDRVVVGVAEGAVLTAALRLYGLPLAAMLAGALVAEVWWGGDLAALAGLAVGGALAGLLRGRQGTRPVVLRQETFMPIRKG